MLKPMAYSMMNILVCFSFIFDWTFITILDLGHSHVLESQLEQIKHSAVPVPNKRSPLSNQSAEAAFFDSLGAISNLQVIPSGFYLCQEEFDEDGYPLAEEIPVGFRSVRRISVELPTGVWFPHAVLWSQAVDLMEKVLEQIESQ